MQKQNTYALQSLFIRWYTGRKDLLCPLFTLLSGFGRVIRCFFHKGTFYEGRLHRQKKKTKDAPLFVSQVIVNIKIY